MFNGIESGPESVQIQDQHIQNMHVYYMWPEAPIVDQVLFLPSLTTSNKHLPM